MPNRDFQILYTIQYKILERENFGEFGKLQEICQNLLVQNFPSYKRQLVKLRLETEQHIDILKIHSKFYWPDIAAG